VANYPDHIRDIVAKFDLKKDELWQVHGSTWVVKHKSIERIGVQLGISWHAPNVIEGSTGDKTVVVLVTGSIDSRIEWSFGEASPANNKNAYPWAMAEKRGKDRVVLKFLAAHGDVYSEEEAEDFKQTPEPANFPGDAAVRRSSNEIKRNQPGRWPEIELAIRNMATVEDLKAYAGSIRAEVAGWPETWRDTLTDVYENRKDELRARAA
jgi:hypothetical protein